MSRIGKMPVKITQGVKVEIKDGLIKVEGPKGKLSHRIPEGITAKVDSGAILITRDDKVPNASALHGLTRTLIHNMVHGVATGFSKELDIVGVGYRASTKGQVLSMTLGYSHPVDYTLPAGITAKVDNNTHVTVTGADKELVGMVAAKIRGFKKPEPYQGKGVRYTNERIIRKEGKAAGAK
ncbi:MAG: 50S ribosomal protein L6 [Bdellovibrionales bacterium]|nr:50S ribosomal protein L6 [Bdellovibrionales bacterium]